MRVLQSAFEGTSSTTESLGHTRVISLICFRFSPLRRLGPRDIDVLRLRLSLEVDPIFLNGLFRYRGASFHRYFATLALFIFTLRRLGAALAIERGDLIYLNGFFSDIVAPHSIAVLPH